MIHLDVYDVTNTTLLGTLQEWYRPSFFDDVRMPGMARILVDVASQDDLALLQPRRVVRWRRGANPGEGVFGASVVQDMPAELVADVDPEEVDRAEGALEQLRKVTELRPDEAESWRDLGDALATEGRDEEARQAFEKVLELEPGEAVLDPVPLDPRFDVPGAEDNDDEYWDEVDW